MTEPYTFEHLSIDEAKEYETLWATVRQALPALSERDAVTVVSLVADSCQSCHAYSGRCQCWNDE